MSIEQITVRGARQHNLKNIDVDIPRDKFVVITGLSGSGKSSLAFDTIYAEGQRRYVESLSAYARQFLGQMDKPDVDFIEGLSPAISIDQKSASRNPRSTVGTITEIYDYLRLLYARIGVPHCPKCGTVVTRQTPQQIVDRILELPEGTRFQVMAPVVRGRKGEYEGLLEELAGQGFVRARIDGEVCELASPPKLARYEQHTIEVIVDRLVSRPGIERRLTDSMETALRLAEGVAEIQLVRREGEPGPSAASETRAAGGGDGGALAFSYHPPYGGVLPYLQRRPTEAEADYMREQIEGYMREVPCPDCQGARLKPESLGVTVDGRNIHELCDLSIARVSEVLGEMALSERDRMIAERVLREIKARTQFLLDVGLDYLTFNRNAGTLAGGEAQRIRLASQIGSGLVGVLYVLDEPSIGLHQRDNRRLIDTLVRLRDLGNTVIVVEHDEDTIRVADHIVDIGPGAGEHGGEIVVSGNLKALLKSERSVTGQYLSRRRSIPVLAMRREPGADWLVVRGAWENNLKTIDVEFPLGCFVTVTGVSGSGKSTLVNDILMRSLMQRIYRSKVVPGRHKKIEGIDLLDKVIDIDQSPIGRTPRSNPATYTGVFDHIRRLFSQTQEAKVRGYQPGRFPSNVKGGRCEACSGDGTIKIEMHFLPDVYVPCEVCKGARYNRDTLDIAFKGKNIAEVLDMPCEEARTFFSNQPAIARHMETLYDVGLGYVRLGQPAPTLSGGEAQRVKLSSELSKRSTGHTMYIPDEPPTGLHFEDIRKLLGVLSRLVDQGNTVLVIEHNLDVIKTADWILDLGPGGGEGGGTSVAEGPPEKAAKTPESYTGQFLTKVLGQ